MIELTISPGLWMTMIIIAAGINCVAGDLMVFKIPRNIIAVYCNFLRKVFNRGKNRRLMGFFLWLTANICMLPVLMSIQFESYSFSSYFSFFLNLYLLISMIGAKKLTKRVKRYLNYYDIGEYSKLQEKIEDTSEINLNLSSKYGTTRT